MPQNDGEVVIQIMGDNSEFANSLKETNRKMKDFGGEINEINKISAVQSGQYRRSVLNAEASLRQLIDAQNDMVDEAGNLRDVSKEVNNLDDAMDNAGKSAITFGDLLKSNIAGEFITEGLHKAADAVKDFIGNGIELASNLQEVQNVVDVTFGDGAAQIYEWADAAYESYGMSSLAAQNYNGTMGAMLKSMGLTDDAILKMSTDMVGLAGDMASFHNLDVEQAFEKIRSGISGETEPLKQLGINMSVANLEAYALSQGIETAYEKMSQSEQAILRYNYLMSVTADAQGDFARTSDSFANQQRILQLNIENLSASLGEKLLPHINDVIVTLNDKLPKAERSIENIGEILGTATSFALEHHEAILGLASAYLTFNGVMSTGKAIQTGIAAFQDIITKIKQATTAQEVLNAVTSSNAFVLLASAVAAVTVGLIAYSNSLDTVGNRIKDVNKEVEKINENTEKSIADSEAEIAVIEKKAEKYEELREKVNRTAGEEEQLKKLAEELQQYMPEGTQLIDEQTGAFNSLADSIDSVAESMRRKATIAAYEEEYTGLIKQQLEAQKLIEEMEENYEKTGRYTNSISVMGVGATQADDIDYINAKKNLEDIQNRLNEVDSAINEKYEDSGKTIDINYTAGSYLNSDYENQYNAEKEAAEKEQKIRDEALQNYVADLDKKLKLRQTSEEQYYSDLKNYLDIHTDTESEAWYDQLERYEDYEAKKLEKAKKAAEEDKKIAEETAKKQKELDDKKIEDEISALKEKQELNDDYTEEMMYNEMETIISGLDKESDLYKKYNSEILKGRKRLADEQEKATEKSLQKLLDKCQKAYDELEKKRETYRKKLLSIGGDIFSVNEVKDKNGNKRKEYTVNNIDEQIKKMREYHAQIKKLKEQDISDGLLEELTSMGSEDSAKFAKYLSGMPEAEFGKINFLYKEKDDIAKELSKDLYAKDEQEITSRMSLVQNALETLTGQAADYGKEAADGLIDGFVDEFDSRYNEIAALFENTDIAAQIKATVETEISKNSAAAFTAPAVQSSESKPVSSVKNPSLTEVLEKLNKPIQLVLDGKVIAESVMQYQKNYSHKTGG